MEPKDRVISLETPAGLNELLTDLIRRGARRVISVSSPLSPICCHESRAIGDREEVCAI